MEKYYKKYTHRDRNIYLCMYNVKRRAALFSQITKTATEIFQNLTVGNHYVPKELIIN